MVEKIYLIRHGLTESNKKRIYAGWSEEPLCQEGIDSLLKIGEKLKDFEIERIYSSPIRRAVQTAQILNAQLKTSIEIEEGLKEMKMGPWEGLSEEEVASKYPEEWKIWNSEPSHLNLDRRETLKELQRRALQAINKISNQSDFSRILAVTHVALIRVLIIFHENLSMDNYKKLEIPNGAVYLLDNKMQKMNINNVL